MQNALFRRRFLAGLAPAAAVAAGTPAAHSVVPVFFAVGEYGAAGDGAHLDTRAIQDAIDECAKKGGGTVIFPAGVYLSGTIVLRNHVTLRLEAGAILLGSKNLQDYPPHVPALRSYTDMYTDKSLIYGEDIENIAIEGHGVIDGQGASFRGPYKVRPYVMRFVGCRNVAVTGVTIRNSPMWVQHYLACDDVQIRGISVHSRVNDNNDGIDIDSCQRVRISDCAITSGDDAIVLKCSSERPCKDVVVTNCVLSSRCNALKLGTESNGGFENINISNVAVYDTHMAGIALEAVDGAVLDHVSISNITMKGVGAPIFIRLGDRARPFAPGATRPPVGKLRNVSISNVQAVDAGITGCAIAGLNDNAIENVILDNIRLTFSGGGKLTDAVREIPEKSHAYPEYNMFGTLPAYGFYCRHLRNLTMRGVQIGSESDGRPGLVCDDVENVEVAESEFASAREAESCIHLTQVRSAFLHGCRTRHAVNAWLQLTGEHTRGISVIGNDLANAREPVRTGPDVAKNAFFLDANHFPA